MHFPERKLRKADNFTAICSPMAYKIEASMSYIPMGLHGKLRGQLYHFYAFWSVESQ
jgi:hypothetical protein